MQAGNRPEDNKVTGIETLVQHVLAVPQDAGRSLIAIAGAPASGKSTLATDLTKALRQAGRQTQLIPMDGFHLDNSVLQGRGLLKRKGAPETFDAVGFLVLMQRLKAGGEIVYPTFDRARDLSVAGAAVLDADCDLAVVEGNYLLFDEAPWRSLAGLWDISIWCDTPESVLLERCVQRWLDHDHTPEEARARAEGNDMANARRIIGARLPADVRFTG
ncbi:nucleoside/nucleotide kinase family protein [Roseibium sp.]|uniref:nucleoside/nucleotide kinase family protein n=1 Tax=Roseibium sp. TaxID=1936156 RepID=UPI00329A7F55